MSVANKKRSGAANSARRRNGSNSRASVEFDAGSLEAELSVIGKSAPARAWAKVPADYFANLDHYIHGAPKRK
jgi:hypothetical protein